MLDWRDLSEPCGRSCPSPRLVRFGTFEVDLHAGELRKGGLKLKLTGQPFQVLAILLERPGEVVTREELQKRLWPDTFVDVDHNLNTAINKIREVLGDSAESPRFVETLPRRGYRFIGPLTPLPTERQPATQSSRVRRYITVGAVFFFLLALSGPLFKAGKLRGVLLIRAPFVRLRSCPWLISPQIPASNTWLMDGRGLTSEITNFIPSA